MKVTLLHNPSAGTGHPDPDTLRRAFERAGHDLVYQSIKDDDFAKALKHSADLLAVAGGDGAVRKVLRLLAHGMNDLPVLIVPVGTANNIARANGVLRPWDAAIRELGNLQAASFRHGFVRGGGIDDFFFESVGIGVFASFLMVADKHPEKIDALAGGLTGFPRNYAALAAFCRKQPPVTVEIISAADAWVTHPIWLEVLNIPCVGPRVRFGPKCDSRASEFLKVACVGEEQRSGVAHWLVDQSHGRDGPFPPLNPLHFDSTAWLSWHGDGFHIDDEIIRFGELRDLSLEVGRAPPKLRVMR